MRPLISIMSFAVLTGVVPAQFDPPTNPPVMSWVTVDQISFLTDQDDGIWFDNEAELLVRFTVDWGPGQGTSVGIWAGDLDMDGPGPWNVNPNLLIGPNLECTPAAAPAITVEGLEMDELPDWFVELTAAVAAAAVDKYVSSKVGGFVGGVAGDITEYAVTELLDALFANDVLTAGVDFNTTTNVTQVNLPPNAACAGPWVVVAAPGVPLPPLLPYAVTPPAPSEIGPDENYFISVIRPALLSALGSAINAEMSDRINELYLDGIDRWHEFGRRATSAGKRFELLQGALSSVEANVLEAGSPITASQFQLEKNRARQRIVMIAYMAAAQAHAEGIYRSAAGVSASAASMASASAAAVAGEYSTAVHLYKAATLDLLRELHPTFNGSSSMGISENTPEATMTINGLTDVEACPGEMLLVNLSSIPGLSGSPFDVAFSLGVPLNQWTGAIPLIDDHINVDLFAPTTTSAISGGPVGASPFVFVPTSGSVLTVPVPASPTAGPSTLQMGILDFSDPDGISMSAPVSLNVQPPVPATLPLGDDSYVALSNAPGSCAGIPHVPFYGTLHDQVFVSSNGQLTFETGSTDFTPTQWEWEQFMPRLGAAADYEPNAFGTVSYIPLSDGLRVDFNGVTEWGTGGQGVTSFELEISQTVGAAILNFTTDGTWGGSQTVLGITNGGAGTHSNGPVSFDAIYNGGGSSAGALASDSWIDENPGGMVLGAGGLWSNVQFPNADGSQVVVY